MRSLKDWLGVLVRGVAMGIAEVVPGVSGGTIAFVSGIYDELISSIAGLSRRSPLEFFRSPVRYWQEQNLTFLAVLALGMGLGIIAFAHVLGLLLESVPPIVWAFFLGLIAASAWHIGRARQLKVLLTVGLLGVLIGASLTQLPVLAGEPALWVFFFGGMIAVSAWILPAVSGSFMLLALGMYAPVLAAVSELNLAVLGTLAAGCVVGLLLFTRVLAWLLARFRDSLLALLTGFMVGALPNLWPWRVADVWHTPASYAAAVGEPHLLGVGVAFLLGVAALLALVRLDR